MKRRDLIRHLEVNGCCLLLEGASRSVRQNPKNGKRTTVPRHREVAEFTAIAICKQLETPTPQK